MKFEWRNVILISDENRQIFEKSTKLKQKTVELEYLVYKLI